MLIRSTSPSFETAKATTDRQKTRMAKERPGLLNVRAPISSRWPSGKFSNKQFFDFEQVEIFTRLKKAVKFEKVGEELYERPDLFNPVWINLTLVFCFSVVANIAAYIDFADKDQYHFNYYLVQKALASILGFAIIVPLLITGVCYVFGSSITFKTFVSILSIYNYSNIFFIAASVACLIPVAILKWLLMIIGAGATIAFLLVNFADMLRTWNAEHKMIILGLIFGLQSIALFAYKLTFF